MHFGMYNYLGKEKIWYFLSKSNLDSDSYEWNWVISDPLDPTLLQNPFNNHYTHKILSLITYLQEREDNIHCEWEMQIDWHIPLFNLEMVQIGELIENESCVMKSIGLWRIECMKHDNTYILVMYEYINIVKWSHQTHLV